jgi:hypothetical protein
MGRLTYHSTLVVEFDDRTLTHLQIVIRAKLRRGEAFFFSWKDAVETGSGRTSVWLHPTIPVVLTFYGNRAPLINRAWVNVLTVSANSRQGLHLVPEPDAPGAPEGVHAAPVARASILYKG